MKIRNIVLALFAVVTVFSCSEKKQVENSISAETEVKKEKMLAIADENKVNAEFTIEGMACPAGCAKPIQKKLNSLDGVQTAEVDFDSKKAKVVYDKTKLNKEDLIAAVHTVSDKYEVKENTSKKGCGDECKMACCEGKEQKPCEKEGKKACCKSKKA